MDHKLSWFNSQNEQENTALALTGKHNMDYQEISDLGRVISRVMNNKINTGSPIIVIVENDMAKVFGAMYEIRFAGQKFDLYRWNKGKKRRLYRYRSSFGQWKRTPCSNKNTGFQLLMLQSG